MQSDHNAPWPHERIESWRGIAAFLGRDERTVQRWEKIRALPVHRGEEDSRNVYALRAELVSWLNTPTSHGDAAMERSSDPRDARMEALPATFAECRDAENGVREPRAEVAIAAVAAPRRNPRRWAFWLAASAFVVFLFSADTYHARLRASPRHGPPEASSRAAAVKEEVSAATTEAQARSSDLELRARYYWSRRTADSLDRALRDFTEAIIADPGNGRAYAGVAATYELMPEFSDMPLSEAFPRALDAARHAVALDPGSAEAHRVLAFALFYWNWDLPAAEREFRRAIALDPKDAEAHHWLATTLLTVHRFPEAEREIDQARELNPSSRSILADRILIDWAADGNSAQAIESLRELEQAEPEFLSAPRYLAHVLWQTGDLQGWSKELKKSAQLSRSPDELAIVRSAERGWQKGGRQGLLAEVRKAQGKILDDGGATGMDLALTCLRMGDRDAAEHALQSAYNAHDYRLLALLDSSADSGLRGYAPFEALRRSVARRLASAG